MGVNIKDFIPKGQIWKDPKVQLLLEGLSVEFNLFLIKLKDLSRNLLITTIDDHEYADIKLDESLPNNEANILGYIYDWTVANKVVLLEYLYITKEINKAVDLQNMLVAYGHSATVDQDLVSFKANMGHINFPLYEESVTYLFNVNYTVAEDVEVIEYLINIYKPAESHYKLNQI